MEEVGKLAVMMMNCQLEIKGRPTFSCKPEMVRIWDFSRHFRFRLSIPKFQTLKQCTTSFDENIHKVYSFMLHRAQSICYAIKQDQFRAGVEMSVNRLMQASHAQILAMQESLKNQKRLNDLELQNLKEFQEKDALVKETQAESLEKLKKADDLINDNLMSLHSELELRKKSEEKLLEIDEATEQIAVKLSESLIQISDGHKQALKEFEMIRKSSKQLDEQMQQQLERSMLFLNSFEKAFSLYIAIEKTIKGIVDAFTNVTDDLGIDVSSAFLVTMMINLVYLAFGMLTIVFLEIKSFLTKMLLIGLFSFNTISAYIRSEVDLLPWNILSWIFVIGEFHLIYGFKTEHF